MSNLRCQDQQLCSLSPFQWARKELSRLNLRSGREIMRISLRLLVNYQKEGFWRAFSFCAFRTLHTILWTEKKWKFVQKRIVWWSKTDSELMIARKFFLKKKSRYSNFVLRFISLCVSLLGLIKCLLSSSISRI